MKTLYNDYLYYIDDSKTIDNQQLFDDCLHIEYLLKKHLNDDIDIGEYGCFSSAHYEQYNIFHFHTSNINKLFRLMQEKVRPVLNDEQYMLQCWLNVFRKGQYVNWHGHWPEEHGVWHGYYCVNVEPSTTTYRFHNGDTVDVENNNGLLVFGKSGLDEHRSSDWSDDNKERVTIAFDIIPISNISKNPVNGLLIPF